MGEHDAYSLAPHMDNLLLDKDFPGYIGGIPGVLVQPEIFDRFAENLPSGKRIRWDECSPAFIEKVSMTGRLFYTRQVPTELSQVPGLAEGLPVARACWSRSAEWGSTLYGLRRPIKA